MYLLRQTPLFLNDLDEVFAFLFSLSPLNCLGFGEEGRKEEKHYFPEGGLKPQGICWMAGKRLVAEEEELGYPSYRKKKLFKGRNDIVVRCSRRW
jgi:hypothetical protein